VARGQRYGRPVALQAPSSSCCAQEAADARPEEWYSKMLKSPCILMHCVAVAALALLQIPFSPVCHGLLPSHRLMSTFIGTPVICEKMAENEKGAKKQLCSRMI
jgi:hypothetical protein